MLDLLDPDPEVHSVFHYKLRIGNTLRETSVITKSDWVGLSLPLSSGNFVLSSDKRALVPQQEVSDVIERARQSKADFLNKPIYRMLRFEPQSVSGTFNVEFALDYYAAGLAGGSGSEYELVQALLKTKGDVRQVYEHRHELLGIRSKYLPDIRALLAFEERVAVVGVDFLVALRRADTEDFGLFVMRRSDRPLTNPGLLALFTGVHQPEDELTAESDLNFKNSVFRELYEELFRGGKSLASEETENHQYLIDSERTWERTPPIRELKTLLRRGYVTLDLVCLGVSLTNGDCEVGIVLVVDDPGYHEEFSPFFNPNWESVGTERSRLLSSRDHVGLSNVLTDGAWVSRSLFVFGEALKRLQNVRPELVRLPDMFGESFSAGA